MNRYFVSQIDQTEIFVDGSEFAHMKVLREAVGDKIILCVDDDFDYVYQIKKIEKSGAICSFLYKEENKSRSKVDICVFWGLLKGDKNDFVVQKLSELGVKKIIPFVSKFSTVKKETGKIDRLQRIAVESAKQCNRSGFMKVENVIDFAQIFDTDNGLKRFDEILLAYENGGERLLQIENYQDKKIALIVGSEGGFCEEEVEFAKQNGAKIVTLGNRILRAETASLVFATVVDYLCKEI